MLACLQRRQNPAPQHATAVCSSSKSLEPTQHINRKCSLVLLARCRQRADKCKVTLVCVEWTLGLDRQVHSPALLLSLVCVFERGRDLNPSLRCRRSGGGQPRSFSSPLN
ncbi:hypothetical protein QQF64_026723 [Cirrhinus molitorella]|uniref:Uncharacterized protein n=1 Tax=Cirrhinus molitorella TaxID=172907 RepID=A0ABR3NAK7_9TELE